MISNLNIQHVQKIRSTSSLPPSRSKSVAFGKEINVYTPNKINFGNREGQQSRAKNGLSHMKKAILPALSVSMIIGVGAIFFPMALPVVPVAGLTYLTCAFIYGSYKNRPA